MANVATAELTFIKNKMLRKLRKWMYEENLPGNIGIRKEFADGVTEFINLAKTQFAFMDGEKIRYPCSNCRNNNFKSTEEVTYDLYRKGFVKNYYNWISHGEPLQMDYEHPMSSNNFVDQMTNWNNYEQLNWDQRMVFDAAGSVFRPQGNAYNESHTNEAGLNSNDGVQHNTDNLGALSEKFVDVVRASDQPLYSGSETHSQLSALARLVNIKSEYNISQSCHDQYLQVTNEMLPRDHTLPNDYYSTKKLIRELCLPVEKIDACKAACMLFWKDDKHLEFCKFCGHAKYKPTRVKILVVKKLHMLSLDICLLPPIAEVVCFQYNNEHMSWHATHETESEVMCHPSDVEAWKHFNETHPDFALESRNVRLGLCADGFAPHEQYGKSYSCWSVIIKPYNLPPGMCMKYEYMFLSLIIFGPANPKRLINVYLQPLIEELVQLWQVGAQTYDASKKDFFLMRAALMWTINDFPAYGMLSSWSTVGIMDCPICMDNTRAFHLRHGRKASYFDCHR
ncbi:UNVERIFIED_CONTAM: hypothetical protein Sradi_4411300 [Sesamum radiatum]|uniref:Transposase-associated domain-containing protein n=1 Tax=Sesamum radiatum TaxID=300843 RepID=A0AAW2NQK3_SESRA